MIKSTKKKQSSKTTKRKRSAAASTKSTTGKTIVEDPVTKRVKSIPKDPITKGTVPTPEQAGGSDTTLTANPLGAGLPDGPSSKSINANIDGPSAPPPSAIGTTGAGTISLNAPTPSAQTSDQTLSSAPSAQVGAAGAGASQLKGSLPDGTPVQPDNEPVKEFLTAQDVAAAQEEHAKKQTERAYGGGGGSGGSGGGLTSQRDPYIAPRVTASRARGRVASWMSVGGFNMSSQEQKRLRATKMAELNRVDDESRSKMMEIIGRSPQMMEAFTGKSTYTFKAESDAAIEKAVDNYSIGMMLERMYKGRLKEIEASEPGYVPSKQTRKNMQKIFATDFDGGYIGALGVNIAKKLSSSWKEPMSIEEKQARQRDEPIVVTEAGDTMTRKSGTVIANKNTLRVNEIELAGSGPLITDTEEKMKNNMLFEGFSYVPPGNSLGPHNRLNNLNYQNAMTRFGMGQLSMPRNYEPYCGPHQQPQQFYESVSPAQVISDILHKRAEDNLNQMAIYQQLVRPEGQLNFNYNTQVSSQGLRRSLPAKTQPVINALREYLPAFDRSGVRTNRLNPMRDIWQGTWNFNQSDSAQGGEGFL